MSWTPDEIIPRPDGFEEWIKYRKRPQHAATQSLMIKVKDPEGRTVELWHVVRDSAGNDLHREQKQIRRRP